MWALVPSDQFDRDKRFYDKKHPRELAAVLHNAGRYLKLLNASKNSRSVQAGFLHTEQKGVIAVDQKGGGQALQQTRLYTYADDQKKDLHLITIGNKNEQSSDVKLASNFVDDLRSEVESQ
jgi:predicted hotdog family 3-hydroxylacyl-ACP dehydratase